jgi:hypothetical protein
MKPDPILEELWRIKDELTREANYDTRRFFEILRQWETDHPHPGPIVRNAKELRDLIAEAEGQRAKSSAVFLKDESGTTRS